MLQPAATVVVVACDKHELSASCKSSIQYKYSTAPVLVCTVCLPSTMRYSIITVDDSHTICEVPLVMGKLKKFAIVLP